MLVTRNNGERKVFKSNDLTDAGIVYNNTELVDAFYDNSLENLNQSYRPDLRAQNCIVFVKNGQNDNNNFEYNIGRTTNSSNFFAHINSFILDNPLQEVIHNQLFVFLRTEKEILRIRYNDLITYKIKNPSMTKLPVGDDFVKILVVSDYKIVVIKKSAIEVYSYSWQDNNNITCNLDCTYNISVIADTVSLDENKNFYAISTDKRLLHFADKTYREIRKNVSTGTIVSGVRSSSNNNGVTNYHFTIYFDTSKRIFQLPNPIGEYIKTLPLYKCNGDKI